MDSVAIVMRTIVVICVIAVISPGAACSDDLELPRETVRIPGTTVEFELARTPAGDEHVGELWVGVTEITWDLYDVFLYGLDEPEPESADVDGVTRPSKPYIPPDRGFGHQGYPALGMTRHAAERFCDWLSKKTGQTYRLPTWAEWMHLARAGLADGETGDPAKSLSDSAWFEDNSDYSPHPVGKKEPNAWGLHDVLGNVAEWVASDEKVPFAMGGSYLDEADRCEARSRVYQTPMWQVSDPQIPKSTWWLSDCGFVGFRVVREVEAESGEEE